MGAAAGLWCALLFGLHTNTESVTALRLDSSDFQIQVAVDADRMMLTIGAAEEDGTRWSESLIQPYAPQIFQYLLEQQEWAVEGKLWKPRSERLECRDSLDPFSGERFVTEIVAHFSFPKRSGDFSLNVMHDLFAETESFHANIFRLVDGDLTASYPMVPRIPTAVRVEDSSTRGLWLRAKSYLGRGLLEPLREYAASVFLLLMILAESGARRILRVTFGFLAGLAVSFLLISYGVLSPSPYATKLAVAFSIAYVAAENLLSKQVRLRAVTALLFGLIHGLPLATGFAAHGSPEHGWAVCLAAFWLGMTVLLLCVGLVWLVPDGILKGWRQRRPAHYERVLTATNLAGIVTGLTLLVLAGN